MLFGSVRVPERVGACRNMLGQGLPSLAFGAPLAFGLLVAVAWRMIIRQPPTPVSDGRQHTHGVADLVQLLEGQGTLVLSGAGLSTESGIPDYRGGGRQGLVRTPINYQQFVGQADMRQRYWARSMVGWLAMDARKPNAGHRAVARLERAGLVTGVITQNVDGLHQAAGSREVVELHGSLAQVVCLRCGRTERRDSMQVRLEGLNPQVVSAVVNADVQILPDGDADLPDALVESFKIPACLHCGGVLKADVVFFGENVPRPRVERAYELLHAADALLVLGSSLAVRSGYRFVVSAKEAGKRVAIINSGPTRGDAEADVRVEGRLGEVLPELARRLAGEASG